MGISTSISTRTCSTDSFLVERKMEAAADGLSLDCLNLLFKKVFPYSPTNAKTIADYVLALRAETNPADHYRTDIIHLLTTFSMFFKNQKTFIEISRDDLLAFLDSFRKAESVDPLHRWIGTYNVYRIHLMRFFKWLYYPDIEQKQRSKPAIIENIPQLKRKEKSVYKPTDLWTEEDDSLFLKYCPSPRDRCYHTMSRDSAAGPHELLKLRIRDVVFKIAPDKKQYAELVVNGKTGSRSIPLICSIPYLKDWIRQHPQSGNPNSILLCGLGKSIGRVINVMSLNRFYEKYKENFFPRLLESPNVPPEDKQKIGELLKKPWNPYIRRHSALTEKSGILKEHYLRQYAGWSPSSQMHLKYLHYYGDESSGNILEAYGIITRNKQLSNVLKPKECPNCSEPNKPDNRFCAKCRMVLTYDTYNETLENQKEKESEVQKLQEKYEQDMKVMREEMNQQLSEIISMIKQNPALAHVKSDVLMAKKVV